MLGTGFTGLSLFVFLTTFLEAAPGFSGQSVTHHFSQTTAGRQLKVCFVRIPFFHNRSKLNLEPE